MPLDTDVFSKLKTFQDYQRLNEEFRIKKQLQQQQLLKTQAGADLPAPLQLANEYQKRIAAGDTEGANLIMQFAKTADKGLIVDANGNYQAAPNYANAAATIAAVKKGAEQQAQDNVKIVTAPIIAGGEANARNASNLNYEPLTEAAKETAKSNALTAVSDNRALPVIEQLKDINSKTFEMPYSDTALVRGVTLLSPSEEVQTKRTNTDLLKQARLDLAAPLAKQLGVNPTDKDFQASLDRIFDINSTQKSRDAQINALDQRIKIRRASNNQEGVVAPVVLSTDSKPLTSAPKKGTVEEGYMYNGGDPSSPSSWKKIR